MVSNKLIKTKAFINGQWVAAESGKTFGVSNPATGEIITSIPNMDRADVRKAIDAADAAWPAYRDMTGKERADLMR